MSSGDRPTPASTSAATIAMPSGLISTPLWPIACAAISASPEAVEADPENAGSCRCHDEPMPKARSAAVSWLAVRVRDRVANAVPQPLAKSEANVAVLGAAGLVAERHAADGGRRLARQRLVLGHAGAESSAAADTMLKDMPGATLPVSVLPSSGSGIDAGLVGREHPDVRRCACRRRRSRRSRTAPPGRSAAACWSVLLSVVCSGRARVAR